MTAWWTDDRIATLLAMADKGAADRDDLAEALRQLVKERNALLANRNKDDIS